ncbi:uracil-DNA glycosylase family protein [Formosa sediminum]|uniref:Uracil-DNA glycosylase family protein n=1 Tax=Formosa sediminum TaxID=2594004 RepID=A0A516GQP4_9FLAO|nr:uracil-DNA glycosylase family protein [Formosa sediminum]QDO93857.1 uracil-DNA glycosylase family protein [Formosa sediminum]
MFKHKHPYPPFIPENTTKLIVGTLPPPRFSVGQFKPGDVNFCYGSINGLLWPILNTIFDLNLKFETTEEAILQRKNFLKSRHIGICDIVESAEREKIDASDLGMQNVELRNLLKYLKQHPKIDTLLFTGGNSKNGPEYFFRKHLKANNLALKLKCKDVPKLHTFEFEGRLIKTVSLTAPSGAANRAVGSMTQYKHIKQTNSKFTTFDFRVMQYRHFF